MYEEFALGCTLDCEYIVKTHYLIRKHEKGNNLDQGIYLF